MILKIKNLEKSYKIKVLNKINLEMQKGDFIAIMGPSGSGKTTLLNCISTIDKADHGSIIINSKEITSMNDNQLSRFRGKELGFIFQDFKLIDNLTAYENIILALTINNQKVDDNQIKKMAKIMEIDHILNQHPQELSGGQKQRVAFLRAIIKNPSIILADEPTGALDSKNAKSLLDLLIKLNQEFNTTILMVTHDPITASSAKEVFFMKDGKIIKNIKNNGTKKVFLENIIEINKNIGEEYVF